MGSPLLTALLLTLGASDNALRDHPSNADGRLTDAEVAVDGDGWMSSGAVRLHAGSFFEWDLGSSQALKGAAIQADHNDTYVLTVSEDAVTWSEAWRASGVAPSGLRTRSAKLEARGRYVRLSAEAGDG